VDSGPRRRVSISHRRLPGSRWPPACFASGARSRGQRSATSLANGTSSHGPIRGGMVCISAFAKASKLAAAGSFGDRLAANMRARVACRRRSSAEAAGRCWLLMARQRGRGGKVWPSGLFWIVGGCGQHYPRILPLMLTAEFHFTGPDGHERAICGLFCRRSLCPNRNGAPPRQPEEGALRRRVQAALRSA